jgi:hypothetical protein
MTDSQTLEYRIEDGLYSLYRGNECLFSIPEVALLLDTDTGVLHKHGCPRITQQHFNRMRAALTQSPCSLDLVMLTGKFPVEELNCMLLISGYAGKYYRELNVSSAA